MSLASSGVRTDLVRDELQRYRAIRDRLVSQVPDIDAETLADTLEGITDFREVVSEIIRSALEDETLVDGLSGRLSQMKERLERLEARAKRKRDLALSAMLEADMGKLIEPDFTASLRQGTLTLAVQDETQIPQPYWRPQPAKLDRQKLLADLKAGTEIAGAIVTMGPVQLSVRSK